MGVWQIHEVGAFVVQSTESAWTTASIQASILRMVLPQRPRYQHFLKHRLSQSVIDEIVDHITYHLGQALSLILFYASNADHSSVASTLKPTLSKVPYGAGSYHMGQRWLIPKPSQRPFISIQNGMARWRFQKVYRTIEPIPDSQLEYLVDGLSEVNPGSMSARPN